jgi:hypothetical protein
MAQAPTFPYYYVPRILYLSSSSKPYTTMTSPDRNGLWRVEYPKSVLEPCFQCSAFNRATTSMISTGKEVKVYFPGVEKRIRNQ